MLSNYWSQVKDWFKHSEVIFLARVQSATAFVVAVLNSVDWTALSNLDFSNGFKFNTVGVSALAIFMHGIVLEWARRRNEPSMQ